MTKIAYTSDVHLEFGDKELVNDNNVDVLVLAGDICTPHYWGKNHNSSVRKMKDQQVAFFRRVSEQFPHVFYIAGNHEHYHGDVLETWNVLHDELAQFENIVCGDKAVLQLNGVLLVGTTLWTDFDKASPMTFINARMGMNDFRLVRKGDRVFDPEDAYNIHQTDKEWIATKLAELANGVTTRIVVSHHLPSFQVVSKGFRDNRLNGAYASDLDDFMSENRVDYWIHGHSHPPCDVMIGNTRVIRQPRGYVDHEHSWAQDKAKTYGIIEV